MTKLKTWLAICALALGAMACDDDVSGGGNAGGGNAGGGGLGGLLGGGGNFDAKGPFDARMYSNTGPNGNYFLFRPDTTLGQNGYKHPIGVWGNGILTTVPEYRNLLTLIASHGFIVIACPSSVPERPCLNNGIEWLSRQNNSGPMAGKLDTSREFAIGYSWGGGAAIDVATRPNMKAVVSLHGMPPRSGPWRNMNAPLLMFTSTGDTFVSAGAFVTPQYRSSQAQTFYATLQDRNAGHLYVVEPGGGVSCVASVALGACRGAAAERAPVVAWLRYWLAGDQSARDYFWGTNCRLCSGQWRAQRKNWR